MCSIRLEEVGCYNNRYGHNTRRIMPVSCKIRCYVMPFYTMLRDAFLSGVQDVVDFKNVSRCGRWVSDFEC
jgi:hypothetical protein